MPRHWLTTVRSILRDLRRANTAKPDESQLELLNITIRQTYDLSGLENICIIEEFLNDDPRKEETDCMVVLFRPKMSADFCSKYVSSLLFGWIAEDISQQIVDSVRIKRNPILQIPNDIYSNGVQAEMTALFRQKTKSKHLYISLVIRKERQSDTQITSSELYTLFSTAVKQALRQPLVNFVEVVTAKTTRLYVTSIVEGWENITNQMEIYQTPWFNFMDVLGQQCVLLAVFEATRMQSPNVKARVPLRDMVPSEQNSKSSKRKLPTTEDRYLAKKWQIDLLMSKQIFWHDEPAAPGQLLFAHGYLVFDRFIHDDDAPSTTATPPFDAIDRDKSESTVEQLRRIMMKGA
ncbi:hypothetical protein G7Y89_g8939 [Cudoniella acicularis]|uniref:Uncharacterized protein n=1 Tax=Cudoniella acicularis TaxID=354080 RepID=A0A8H4RFM5_9HELO|nr:hypothetical protein G7Y89_g8939 [Cudoniella acicularis]